MDAINHSYLESPQDDVISEFSFESIIKNRYSFRGRNKDKCKGMNNVLIVVLSVFNVYMFLYNLRGMIELGGPYFGIREFTLRVILFLPSVYMSTKLTLKFLYPKNDENNHLMKMISYFYMSFILMFVSGFLYIFITKFGYPSFYKITAWYIYYFGILYFYPCILLSAMNLIKY